MLKSREAVLMLKPDFASISDLAFGVIGAWDSGKDGGDTPFKVKAFAIKHGINEDPVCETLNASKAQWLIRSSLAPKSYVAANVVLGRDSRIYVDQIDDTL